MEIKKKKIIKSSPSPCFKILNYTIKADKYCYIVKGSTPAGKDEDGEEKTWNCGGFHRTLEDALSDIRQNELRASTLDAKTLDRAVEKLVECNEKFNKLIEPLRKLENL